VKWIMRLLTACRSALAAAMPLLGAVPAASLTALVPVPAHAQAAPAAALSPAQLAARRALFDAVQRDDPHALRTALLRGADPNLRNELGQPAIVAAARDKSWRAVRALAELDGTLLDATDGSDNTALMQAALHGELPMVEYLVSRKAQVNKTGWTALHYAAANGHEKVVRHLLEQHAYIDAESPNRTTPLMMASRQGHPTVVQLLIEEGADPTVRSQSGWTAARYATAGGDPKLGEWLAGKADAFARRYAVPPAPAAPR
jgi:ankyrin repeat protein